MERESEEKWIFISPQEVRKMSLFLLSSVKQNDLPPKKIYTWQGDLKMHMKEQKEKNSQDVPEEKPSGENLLDQIPRLMIKL